MDEMLISELQDCLANIQYADRSLWESSRINSYITCQVNSRKKLKLADVYTLPFDESDDDDEKLSRDDFAALQQQAAALDNIINAQQPTTETNYIIH